MRPQKDRIVAFNPDISYFKPRGIPMMDLEEVRLTVDECEALRLSDLLDLSHEDGGKQMGVSRATFGRILQKARSCVADALINPQAVTPPEVADLVAAGKVRFVGLSEVRLVFWFVLFAWSGLGAAFAPLILLALTRRGVNRFGALAAMLTGIGSCSLSQACRCCIPSEPVPKLIVT